MNNKILTTISVIDYGMCNLGSIINMSRKLGFRVVVATKPNDIINASHLILPGVGAFDHGVEALKKIGLFDVIIKKMVHKPVPFLGICLGMQLLCDGSEEGNLKGLGLISGKCKHFIVENGSNLRIPHMGWNEVKFCKESPIAFNLKENSRFYFTHSYHMVCEEKDDLLAISNHGKNFTAAIQKGNVVGVQFHPEKSHKFGMSLFKNFGNWHA